MKIFESCDKSKISVTIGSMAKKKIYDFKGIPVEIEKKKMKNMYIRVDSKTAVVKVSIPNSVSYAQAEEFVERNIEWVTKTRAEAIKNACFEPTEYNSGECILLWGKKYKIDYIPSYCDKGIYTRDDRLIIYAPRNYTATDRKKMVEKWLRNELINAIDRMKKECCEIARTEPEEWHIRDMRTKWGTCNYVDRRIWISLALVHKDIECLKYVMLHELTHLYVPNHGPEFKAYMDDFCPNWRIIKKKLNNREEPI